MFCGTHDKLVTEVRFVQPLNAPSPIFIVVQGIVTEESSDHSKLPLLISSTELGRVTDVTSLQRLKTPG